MRKILIVSIMLTFTLGIMLLVGCESDNPVTVITGVEYAYKNYGNPMVNPTRPSKSGMPSDVLAIHTVDGKAWIRLYTPGSDTPDLIQFYTADEDSTPPPHQPSPDDTISWGRVKTIYSRHKPR